jgi:hypothetical protein
MHQLFSWSKGAAARRRFRPISALVMPTSVITDLLLNDSLAPGAMSTFFWPRNNPQVRKEKKMKVKRFFVITLIIALAASAFLFVTVAAVNNTIVVTPTNQQGWSTADTRPGGAVDFVVDSTAPSGIGALQLTTDATTTAKAQYLHAANTPLANVTELSFYTRQVSGPPFADPSYQLPVCLGGFTSPQTLANPSGCTGFTTFVFEPYQNNGLATPSPVIVPNIWQQWDVDAGQFWSSRTASVGGTCSVTAGGGGPPFYSLVYLQNNCPNAVVVGFGVNIGSNNPSYDVYTDLVDFNGTTYDFEPYVVASNKDQCKSGGYSNVKRADGSSFKNQGDCIQYVNTGK